MLFVIHGYADSHKDENSTSLETICSPTECYTVLKVLGEGAFGKVYAVENSAGQRFAIKSYKHQDRLAQDLFANPEREYMRGQLLHHSNIVKAFDLFEFRSSDNQGTYLVLELIEGKTVHHTPRKSLILNQAIHSSLQIVDALRYALSEKLLHLDLHSNNVMLTLSSDAMVIDLASFYSFDEVLRFVATQKSKEEEQSKATENSDEGEQSKGKANRALLASVAQMQNLEEKKLQQFFLQHPNLLNKLQKANKKGNRRAIVRQAESDQIHIMPMLSYYFDSITEVCIQLITKSDLSREDKLRLRAAIKTLAWNYSEDVDDELVVPIEHYFDQLVAILQS